VTGLEFAAGSVWFVLYAIGTFLAVRLSPNRSPALVVMLLACLFTLASAPVGAVTHIEANYWRALVVFLFLLLCHLMIFGAAYKSISLRILLDLYRAPSRKMSAELVFSRYIEQESFMARIQIIVTQGLASYSSDGIILAPKGQRLAAAVGLLQRLYDIKTSG
jgi:hypothetical protein